MPLQKNTVSVIVCLVVLGIYAFLNSQLFLTDRLEWTGLTYIQQEELVKLSEFTPKNVLRVDSRSLAVRLEQHPWVDSADVKWSWPNQLTVHIEERRPLALIPISESWYLLDQQGNLLPPPLGVSIYSLPLVTNVDTQSTEQLRSIARLLFRIPQDLWESISEYNASTRQLITRQGTRVALGELQDLSDKFALLRAILDDLSLQGETAKQINLEVPRNPVVITD